uniref:Variant surface glycoprotein 1125.353 n=1 Tax=Trypanosoma brucei TaxID=5691 RepID=A0A1J0R499_9TRYP|nr:variant surface glycoprotein 1125.353 [Trypanosoma brucei]
MTRSTACRLLAITAGFLLCGTKSARGTAGKGQGLLEGGWKPLCEVSNELDDIPNGLALGGRQILDKIADISKDALRLQIIIAAHAQTEETEPYVVLSLWFGTEFNRAYNLYANEGTVAHLNAAKATSYLKGRIDEALSFLAESQSSTHNGCLLQGGSANAAAISGPKIHNTHCPRESSEIQPKEVNRKHVLNNGFPNVLDGTRSADELQGATNARKCHLLHAHNTDGYALTEPITGNPKLFGGYLTVTKSNGVITAGNKQKLETTKHAASDPWQNVVSSLNNLQKDGGTTYSYPQPSGLAPSQLRELITPTFLRLRPGTEDSAKAHITRLFGEAASDKIKGYLKSLDNFQVPSGIAGLTTTTALRDIKEYDKLLAILAHYQISLRKQIIALEKKAEGAGTTKPNTDSESECNKLDNEEKCNADKKCIYDKTKEDRKKCSLRNEEKEKLEKEGNQEKGEKDGKNTNTTGSNSFVINKSPLWLAVLFF